ncbi:MAG TPA: POTRA domain-containing protein, partial [Anaeromyxobacteraceae bacterium]|nr:POTRA domain-containing protein [Anaeromyxobacteraceae bacterium]
MSALAVLASLLLGAAPVEAAPPAPPRPLVVGTVELRAPPGVDPAPLRPLVTIRSGEPLTSGDTRRTVRALYQTGLFSNVRVVTFPAGGTEAEPRVRVEIELEPRRVVASVRVDVAGGALPVPEDDLLKSAALPRGAEVYPGRLEASAAAMRALLARHGWRQARVTAAGQGATQVAVTFAVEAGEPTRVAAVEIGPSPGLDPDALRQIVQTRPGEVLDEDLLEEDLRAIREALRKAGYYRARVDAPVVAVDGLSARVDFRVDSGPRFTFRFTGDAPFPPAQLRARLGYEGEVPLDGAALEGAAERLQSFLAAYGFTQARVWTE